MTLITPFGDGPKDESLLAAEELFEEASLALADLNKKIRNDDLDAARATKAVLSEMSLAYAGHRVLGCGDCLW